MEQFSPEQVERFAEDIAFVRRAIQKNISVLQQMDFRSSLRLTVLLAAIGTFLFCALFHFAMKHFGGYAAIPVTIKVILFSTLALVAAAIGLVKNSGIMKSARTADPSVSLSRLMREYYTIKVYHHFVPLVLVIAFGVIYASVTGAPQLVIPIAAIGVGLVCNSFGSLLRVDEFLWASYWLIVTGGIVLIFHSISPLLGISLTAGCALLLTAAALYLPQKKQQEV
jgi:hypothetical protein